MFNDIHTKKNLALFIALLFHVSGLIGILFTVYKPWFIEKTTFNLLLMFGLLVWVQSQKNKIFFLFLGFTFVVGMLTEIIGVNTGLIFGHYQYGNLMGVKFFGVPWLIGLNWFNVVFCSGVLAYAIKNLVVKKLNVLVVEENLILNTFFVALVGATIATAFDFILEPAAIKLGFWQWQNNTIPVYNFLSWFIISFILLLFFNNTIADKKNNFAIQLMFIQILFFIFLNFFL